MVELNLTTSKNYFLGKNVTLEYNRLILSKCNSIIELKFIKFLRAYYIPAVLFHILH